MSTAWLACLLAAALLIRLVAAALTSLPSQDGVSYLWMAEQFAAGELAAPFGEVFPPLLPLLLAPWIALGVEPFAAGKLLLALAGAAAAVPCARLMSADASLRGDAVVLASTLGLPIRFGAEIYTEPLFIACAAMAIGAGLCSRPWRAGIWSGLAFWLRPEALAIPMGLVLADRRRWPALVPAAGAVLALALARGLAGHGFDPLPKLAFHKEKLALGDGADPDWLPRLAENLALLPSAWLEAFQLLGIMALAGSLLLRGPRARAFCCVLGIGLLAILLFVVRRRFLVSWTPTVLPFAYAGLALLGTSSLRRWLFVAVAAALGLWVGLRPTEPDKEAERDVGRWLATRLLPGEQVAGDLPRVIWFAGRRPPPPRHLTIDELVTNAQQPDVRFVVLGARREQAAEIQLLLPAGFRPVALPFPAARVAVWER